MYFDCFWIVCRLTVLVSEFKQHWCSMFLTRIFGRTFLAAARSEASAATAAAGSTARTGYNPLEEFFEVHRSPEDDKPVVYGIFLCFP